jgi:hypothetical protein
MLGGTCASSVSCGLSERTDDTDRGLPDRLSPSTMICSSLSSMSLASDTVGIAGGSRSFGSGRISSGGHCEFGYAERSRSRAAMASVRISGD